MLDWQVNWINDNLSKLRENTTCTILLLDELHGRGQITEHEVRELERMANYDEYGGYKKVREFYSLLKTRDAYDDLIQALEKHCQTEAAQILKEGWHVQDSESRKKKSRLQNYISLPRELEEFLKPNIHSGKICVISTLDCDVTCERIKDSGGIPVVTWEGTSFGSEMNKNTTFAISHVENVGQMVNSRISDAMRISKRIIIITRKSKEDVLKEVPKSGPITVIQDKLTLADLSENYKKDILSRNVIIQSRSLPFIEWIHATGVSLNDQEVSGQLLIDLINNKTPELLKDTMAKKEDNYVERKLRSRTILSRDKIFQDTSKDVFVFSGLEINQLSMLVTDGRKFFRRTNPKLEIELTGCSGNQITKKGMKTKKLSVRFILLEEPFHFEDICERTSEPVHWVAWMRFYKNDVFHLVKSRGSIKVIQGMIEDENKQYKCSEEKFLEKISSKDLKNRVEQQERISDSLGMGNFVLKVDDSEGEIKQNGYFGKEFLDFISSENLGDISKQHICISDSPGMGKSVLLAEVGRQLLEKNSTLVGIFQELPKLLKSIKGKFPKEEIICVDSIIQHLFSLITTCAFSKGCLESGLKSESLKINLFLDAYDEVDSKDVDLCKTILNDLKDCGNIRVFIASRPHLLPELENIFKVLGWNILPFTEKDQYNFLLSCWTSRPEGKRFEEMEIDLLKLEIYTRKFASALQNQWNDKDRAIAGIPLQCHLISVIFHDEAFLKSIRSNLSNSSEPSPNILSLSNLYNEMVKKKFKIFKEKYPSTTVDYRKVEAWHAFQALADLFPEVDYEILFGEDDADPQEMIKIGIVEGKGDEGKINFIHRTFAEYFIAQALSQLLTNPQNTNLPQELQISLVSFFEVLFTLVKNEYISYYKFRWLEILHHLNALLEDANPVCKIPLNLSEEDLAYLSESILCEDLENIFKLLDFWDCFIGKPIVESDFLFKAVQYSCIEFIELLIKHKTKEEMKDIVDSKGRYNLLSLAVERGDFQIFEFILITYYAEKVESCSQEEDDLSSLLHYCVRNSSKHSDVIIKAKKGIIERLLKLNKSLLEFSDLNAKPILCQSVHPQLIYFLIDQGADVFVRTEGLFIKSLLDKACEEMCSNEFFHLLKILDKAGHLERLMRINDASLLDDIFSRHNLPKDTFTMFSQIKVDIRYVSKFILKYAFSLPNDESEEYLKAYFDVWIEQEKESNPIAQSCLHAAVKAQNPEILGWFMKTNRLIVNCVEAEHEDTPLHICCRIKISYPSSEEISKIEEKINLLLNNDGDPCILNSKEESVLHLAAEYSFIEIVKIFIDKVEDINGKDCTGNTALLRAVKNKDYDSILNVLLDHGADPKVVNNRGENLLHLLAWDEVWVKRLVDKVGLSVDSTDKKGNTPLHFAALESECMQVISKLVDKGGKISAKNKGGFTPFHVYLDQASFHSFEVVKYFISRDSSEDQMTKSLRTLISRQFNHPSLERDSLPQKNLITNFYPCDSTATTVGIANELLSNGADVEGLIWQIFKGLETSKPDFQFKFLKLLHDHNACSPEVIAYQGLGLMVKCDEISEDYLKLGNTFAQYLEDINKTDSERRTLLHLACQARSLKGVKFLVDKRAKVSEPDGNGKTPLDVVYLESVKLLEHIKKTSTSLRFFGNTRKFDDANEIANFLENHKANWNTYTSSEFTQVLNSATEFFVKKQEMEISCNILYQESLWK